MALDAQQAEQLKELLRDELKPHIKRAVSATGSVQYPDLLLYLGQQVLRDVADEILDRFEKKGLIERKPDDMGTVIYKKEKKG